MLTLSLISMGQLTRSQDSQPIAAGRACICKRKINPPAQGSAGSELRIDWAIVSGQDRAVGRELRCP